ncbi:uncharacterized protein LOC144694757 [Cetorhinus maximus]
MDCYSMVTVKTVKGLFNSEVVTENRPYQTSGCRFKQDKPGLRGMQSQSSAEPQAADTRHACGISEEKLLLSCHSVYILNKTNNGGSVKLNKLEKVHLVLVALFNKCQRNRLLVHNGWNTGFVCNQDLCTLLIWRDAALLNNVNMLIKLQLASPLNAVDLV